MYSKQTENLGLPQWDYKDHPDFLTDVNEAFGIIDTAVSKIEGASPEVVEELGEKLAAIEGTLDKIQEEGNEIDSELEKTATLVELHTTQIADINTNVGELQADMIGAKESILKLSEEDSSLQLQIDALQKELDDKGYVSTAELDAVKESVDEHTTQINGLQEQLTLHTQEIENIENNYIDNETWQERKQIVDQNIQNLNTFAQNQQTKNGQYEDAIHGVENTNTNQDTEIQALQTATLQHAADLNTLDMRIEALEDLQKLTEGMRFIARYTIYELNSGDSDDYYYGSVGAGRASRKIVSLNSNPYGAPSPEVKDFIDNLNLTRGTHCLLIPTISAISNVNLAYAVTNNIINIENLQYDSNIRLDVTFFTLDNEGIDYNRVPFVYDVYQPVSAATSTPSTPSDVQTQIDTINADLVNVEKLTKKDFKYRSTRVAEFTFGGYDTIPASGLQFTFNIATDSIEVSKNEETARIVGKTDKGVINGKPVLILGHSTYVTSSSSGQYTVDIVPLGGNDITSISGTTTLSTTYDVFVNNK